MTKQELEQLLFRGESNVLDFKSAQYRFIGASDSDKAELLKDCLAFANSWREEPAFILIGVEKTTGQEPVVIGIEKSAHIDDASLQQFVCSKTNFPVHLLYEEVLYDALSVGVIRFEGQKRPVYLLKDFDRLKKHAVYIRRGSSTVECTPQEVAQMGLPATPKKQLKFELQFFIPESGAKLGPDVTAPATRYLRPDWIDRRDPLKPFDYSQFLGKSPSEKFDAVNDIARFVKCYLQVANIGTATARDVEIMIGIPQIPGLTAADNVNPPQKKYWNQSQLDELGRTVTNARLKLSKPENFFHLSCPMLHAGQVFLFDPIYLACPTPKPVKLAAKIFADDLAEPVRQDLTVAIQTRPMVYEQRTPDDWGF